MSLDEIFSLMPEDPETSRKREQLQEELDRLKEKIHNAPPEVTDAEILRGIRKQFDLSASSDFLEEASWLMDALSFTRTRIPTEQIPNAWDAFQRRTGDIRPFSLDEYPILEAMAQWYFEHREDGGFDEREMVAHSLAVYEYLLLLLGGLEGTPEYEGLLSGIGPTVVYLYCGIGQLERAKFYAQLLEREYKAGRLPEEDYLQVMKFYEEIVIREHGGSLAAVKEDLHKINRLCWDTIADRDRRIDRLTEENGRLIERVARATSPVVLGEAQERLRASYG